RGGGLTGGPGAAADGGGGGGDPADKLEESGSPLEEVLGTAFAGAVFRGIGSELGAGCEEEVGQVGGGGDEADRIGLEEFGEFFGAAAVDAGGDVGFGDERCVSATWPTQVGGLFGGLG